MIKNIEFKDITDHSLNIFWKIEKINNINNIDDKKLNIKLKWEKIKKILLKFI